jgi:hypothetical protein
VVIFNTLAPWTALRRSLNKKDPVPSSRVPFQTSSVALVVPSS